MVLVPVCSDQIKIEMVRNKNQSPSGLSDSRRENLDDNRQNLTQNREASADDLRQRNNRKDNKTSRKGGSGKNNHQ
jgi:hypothetical protein